MVAGVLVAVLVYMPGLQGGFVFDDFANLPALGRYGGVKDGASLGWFLTSGVADPTGRPLAMLSFLIDARNWPADPWPFKRTNLVIHLINALALMWLLLALGRRACLERKASKWAALLAACLWLLHPLWVSTVLYIVQRQAMLAALFVLLGLRAWVASGDAFARGNAWRGWGLAILAVPLSTTLAGLCKANGFLLPLLAVVIDATLPAVRSPPSVVPVCSGRSERIAKALLTWLPAALILVFIVYQGISAAPRMAASRGWSLGQRLLTEPRALLDYLYRLLLPGARSTGVFNDDFGVSRDIWHPWTTLPSALLILVLLGVGWQCRRHAPTVALAILFFFAGHAMESTFIALELYFDHRNYLPSIFIFWPIAQWLVRPGAMQRVRGLAAMVVLGLFAAMVAIQSMTWGDPLRLARYWANVSPHSARAQSYVAALEMQRGAGDAALRRLLPLARRHPLEVQYAVTLTNAYCLGGVVPNEQVDRTRQAFRVAGVKSDLAYQWLAGVLMPGSGDACAGLSKTVVSDLMTDLLSKNFPAAVGPEYRGRKLYLEGLYALRAHQCRIALDHFTRRLKIQPRPEFVQTETILLAQHCDPLSASLLLDSYLSAGKPTAQAASPVLRLRDWLMMHDGYWDREWARLRLVLSEESAANEAKVRPSW